MLVIIRLTNPLKKNRLYQAIIRLVDVIKLLADKRENLLYLIPDIGF